MMTAEERLIGLEDLRDQARYLKTVAMVDCVRSDVLDLIPAIEDLQAKIERIFSEIAPEAEAEARREANYSEYSYRKMVL